MIDVKIPPSGRWMASVKAKIASSIKSEADLKEIAEKYNIPPEELRLWVRRFQQHGAKALRATKVQDYRAVA